MLSIPVSRLQSLSATVAVATALTLASPAAAQTFRVNDGPAPRLGQGFDVIRGTASPQDCVTGPVLASAAPGVQQLVWHYELHDSASNYASSIGGRTALQAAGLFWSMNARGAFLRSRSASAHSLYLELRTELIATTEQLGSTQQIPSQRSANAFRSDCGTHAVTAVRRGGFVNALVRIEATSQHDHDSLMAGLNVTIGKVKNVTDFASQVDRALASRKVQIDYAQRGGAMPVGPLVSVSDVMAAADSWMQSVQGAPEVVDFTVSNYPIPLNVTELGPLARYTQRILAYEDELRRLELDARILAPLSAASQRRDGTCDEASERVKLAAEVQAYQNAIEALEQAAETCQATSTCPTVAAHARAYQTPTLCRIGCAFPIQISNLMHGQPSAPRLTCDTRDPDGSYDHRLKLEASFHGWCAANTSDKAPHQDLRIRVDGGDRTGYVTASGNPPGKVTYQHTWQTDADEHGVIAPAIEVYNEVQPAGVPGQPCDIQVDGSLIISH